MKFPCIKCGLCCRNIHNVIGALELDNGKGVCKHLNNDLCSVYNNRPAVCNVEVMYDLYFADKMSKEHFFKLNIKSCINIAKSLKEVIIVEKLEKCYSNWS
jgi:Fe-S-cluster containining protein